MADVTMPRLSDTMEEGTIASWLKQPGEEVKKGDVIAQIETDKATMDLTAFEAGTLQEILAPEGTTVPIGQPVARIGSGAAKSESRNAPQKTETARHETPTTSERSATAEGERDRANDREDDGGAAAANGKTRASPMARHIAAEHGLDLTRIHGSGPQGRVIRSDVEAALHVEEAQPSQRPETEQAAEPTPAPPVRTAAAADDERVALSQMRRTIARRMAEATRTVPHFFLTTTVDATELVRLRKQVVDQLSEDVGIKITFNDLLVKGAALALRNVPEVNVSFADDALIRHRRIHIGIAVATDRGLIVPVIRDVESKSLSQISRETRDLAERASSGKLQPAEYGGGTFTISNLGMFGIEQFNAVINPPEAAILAVGAIIREPAEHDGQVALRDRMKLTLSVDHRALDGAIGARYLQALKHLLEKPMLLLV
jgi:pyruvate dehydrogenase E2 component (dihydrolipoamide acetyltransferase)